MRSHKGVTLAEIARRAGTSSMTVSRVLSGGKKSTGGYSARTRDKVLRIAQELGYHPNLHARRLAHGNTNLIGVVTYALARPIRYTETDAAVRALLERGCEPYVWPLEWVGGDAPHMCDVMLSNKVAGLILVGDLGTQPQDLDPLVQADVPIVSLDAGPDFPGVGLDRIGAYHDLTRYLLQLGHRRLGLVGAAASAPWTEPRIAGIRAACEEAGVQTDLQLLELEPEALVLPDFELARRATKWFLNCEPRPTAVMFFRDAPAIGFMHELQRAGMAVPGDVSVAGFYGIPAAEYSLPPLTTVVGPVEQVGREAAEVLVRMVEAEDAHYEPSPSWREIAAQILVRESCGAVAHPSRKEV